MADDLEMAPAVYEEQAKDLVSSLVSLLILSQAEFGQELLRREIINDDEAEGMRVLLQERLVQLERDTDQHDPTGLFYNTNLAIISAFFTQIFGSILSKSSGLANLIKAIDQLIQSLDPTMRQLMHRQARATVLKKAIENMRAAEKIQDTTYRDKFKDLIYDSVTKLSVTLASLSV